MVSCAGPTTGSCARSSSGPGRRARAARRTCAPASTSVSETSVRVMAPTLRLTGCWSGWSGWLRSRSCRVRPPWRLPDARMCGPPATACSWSGTRPVARSAPPRCGGTARASRRRPASGAGCSRQGRHCASRPCSTRPACAQHLEVLRDGRQGLVERGGQLRHRRLALAARRARMARRVGSARAANVVLRGSAGIACISSYRLIN